MASAPARFPFVSKADILRAYRPGVEVSERTFRTLREHRVVSAGLVVHHRRGGRVVGQLRCYAALNLDAAVLARHDRPKEAARAAKSAARFEAKWQPLVAQLAAEWDLGNFEAFLAARNLIAHSLAPASAQLEELHARLTAAASAPIREEFVRIAQLTNEWATLQIINAQVTSTWSRVSALLQENLRDILAASTALVDYAAVTEAITAALGPLREAQRQLAVDAFVAKTAGLAAGDLALLRIEHSAGASFLSLLPAVQEEEEEVAELESEFLPYFSDEPLPSSTQEDLDRRRREGGTIPPPSFTVPLAS